jgi:hypothetical protein
LACVGVGVGAGVLPRCSGPSARCMLGVLGIPNIALLFMCCTTHTGRAAGGAMMVPRGAGSGLPLLPLLLIVVVALATPARAQDETGVPASSCDQQAACLRPRITKISSCTWQASLLLGARCVCVCVRGRQQITGGRGGDCGGLCGGKKQWRPSSRGRMRCRSTRF